MFTSCTSDNSVFYRLIWGLLRRTQGNLLTCDTSSSWFCKLSKESGIGYCAIDCLHFLEDYLLDVANCSRNLA